MTNATSGEAQGAGGPGKGIGSGWGPQEIGLWVDLKDASSQHM